MNPRILIIDDADFTAIYLEGLIGDQYRIEHAPDGETGVAEATRSLPDLVLMDVKMPGMDGYDACRLLKQSARTADIPVIFLSARVGADDRLAGYEAGGDDYITKPFSPEELKLKIALAFRNLENRKQLSQQVADATQTAMTAMSSMGDIGIIMRLMRQMQRCLDLPTLADTVQEAMSSFGLEHSLQLRDDLDTLSRTSNGPCSPLEESVLSNMRSCARIVDLANRSSFNYPGCSIIVKNMPRDLPELYGRIKDNIAIVAEAVDIHILYLNSIKAALRRGEVLLGLLNQSMDGLRTVEQGYRTQRAASSQIFNQLVEGIEGSFVSLGLTEDQEAQLQHRLRDALAQHESLFGQELAIDHLMRSLTGSLDKVLREESRSLMPPPLEPVARTSPAGDDSIELF